MKGTERIDQRDRGAPAEAAAAVRGDEPAHADSPAWDGGLAPHVQGWCSVYEIRERRPTSTSRSGAGKDL